MKTWSATGAGRQMKNSYDKYTDHIVWTDTAAGIQWSYISNSGTKMYTDPKAYEKHADTLVAILTYLDQQHLPHLVLHRSNWSRRDG